MHIFLTVRKQQYLPAISMVKWICSAHTHTHTHHTHTRANTHTRILSISLSSKQNMTDWQTDCAGNRLTDRRTHAAQTDRANTQTAICTYSTTEGGLPLAPAYAHALARTHTLAQNKKCDCFFFFFFSSSESVSLYSCVTAISMRVSYMFLSSFFPLSLLLLSLDLLLMSPHPCIAHFLILHLLLILLPKEITNASWRML